MSILYRILRILDSRALFLFFGLIFRAVLELAYKDFVSPWYEYAGFILEMNGWKYFESWILYLSLLLFLPASLRKPSDFLICLAFFVFFAPLLVFYGLTDSARWVVYSVLLQYAILSLMRMGWTISLPVLRNGPTMALILTLAGSFVATVWMISAGGLANFNLDMEAVYQFRAAANDAIYSGSFGYIVVWATTVCGPFLLMLALRGKHHILALGIIGLHVFWFGLTSHKAVLFYPVLVVALYMFFKYSRALSVIPLGLSFVVMASLAHYYLTENLVLGGLFIRRVFFVPSHLTFTYFEFFDNNPLVYWSNSFLSGLMRYPYAESPALVIGGYLNHPVMWANNSFFSTGYMHAGFYGVLIYGLVAGLLLKILDSLTSNRVPLWISISVVIVPFFNLFTSSDLPAALLTHGLGFGIIVLYLMGSRTEIIEGAVVNSQNRRPNVSS